MRILHTSDWHLGRSFHRVGMLQAQAAWVDFVVDVVRREKVDAVVVAGDVYDRALPGVDVVTVLDDALVRLVDAGAEVVVSSGNHDSARRLGFAARLLDAARVHVRTAPGECGSPVLLSDRYGHVALYALPYLEPALVAEVLGCRASHADALGVAMAAVHRDLSQRPVGTRSVVSAHAFVVGGAACDSERDIGVGGVQSVPLEVFDGVDYVALGHLHGRQRLSEAVRYSGSPLAYSFSEHPHTKGAWLVELGPDGVQRVDAVDAPVPRRLAVLRAALSDVLTDPALAPHEGAWCQVTLTDAERPREAMAAVRGRFPHTLELRWEPVARQGDRLPYAARARGRDDVEVCCGFLEHVRGRRADGAEEALLRAAVEAGRIAEAQERGVAPLRPRRGRGGHVPPGVPHDAMPARDAG